MKFAGFYNYSPQSGTSDSSGTTLITGTGGALISGSQDNVCPDNSVAFFGSFTNLSAIDIDIDFLFWDGSHHTHDLRAYESIKLRGVSIKRVAVSVNGTVKLHGMGFLIKSESAQDDRILLMQAQCEEAEPQGRSNHWDTFKDATSSTATTTDVWIAAATTNTIRLWKVTIWVSGACNVTLQFTDSANGNINKICKIAFGGTGSYTIDSDLNGLDNPQYGGKLRMVTDQAINCQVDAVGTEVSYQ